MVSHMRNYQIFESIWKPHEKLYPQFTKDNSKRCKGVLKLIILSVTLQFKLYSVRANNAFDIFQMFIF